MRFKVLNKLRCSTITASISSCIKMYLNLSTQTSRPGRTSTLQKTWCRPRFWKLRSFGTARSLIKWFNKTHSQHLFSSTHLIIKWRCWSSSQTLILKIFSSKCKSERIIREILKLVRINKKTFKCTLIQTSFLSKLFTIHSNKPSS